MCSILCRDQCSGADKVAIAVRDGGKYPVAPYAKYRVDCKSCGMWNSENCRKQRVSYSTRKYKNYRKKKVSINKKEYVGEKERKLCKQHIKETVVTVA